MKAGLTLAAAAVIAAVLVTPLASQDSGGVGEDPGVDPICPVPDGAGATCFFGRPLLLGAPFTANAVTSWTPPASTGERRRQTSWRYYRDRHGNVRVEQVADGGAPQVIIANATHTYVLKPETRTAVRIGRGGAEMMAPSGAAGRFLVALTPTFFVDFFRLPLSETFNAHEESLGGSVMAGLPVTGTRYTGSFGPGGFGTPNGFTLVDERWVSAQLRLVIHARGEDPYMGTLEHTVTDVVPGDPVRDLFNLPADYADAQEPAWSWRPPYRYLYTERKP